MMIGVRHRRTFQTTGAVLAALYAVVMVLAVACAFGHTTPTHAHHQPHDPSSHSALCLWACHADVGTGLQSAPDRSRPHDVVLAQVLPLLFVVTITPLSVLRLRGPPFLFA